MKLRSVTALVIGLLLVFWIVWVVQRLGVQHREMAEIRLRLQSLDAMADQRPVETPESHASHPLPTPSPELLRDRATVAALRGQLAAVPSPTNGSETTGTADATEEDLDRLMKGRLPSSYPDFVAAAAIRNQGFDTPDHALESFWWHFAGPDRARAESVTEIWWKPEEPAPEGYHYAIHLGMGVGSFTGYRVAGREEVSPDEVVFQLQREEGRSVVEEEARFIRVGDRWIRKPAIRLVKDGE